MNRLVLVISTLIFFTLPACSGETGANDGTVKIPTTTTTQLRGTASQAVISTSTMPKFDFVTQLEENRTLLFGLLDQGVCVITLELGATDIDGVPVPNQDREVEAKAAEMIEAYASTHASTECIHRPYLKVSHDPGIISRVKSCNQPDPITGGIGAVMVMDKRVCSS